MVTGIATPSTAANPPSTQSLRNRRRRFAITGLTYLKDKGHDVAVTLDADGQHLPECIPQFIARHRETACELVLGRRPFSVRTMPFLRLVGNQLSSFWVSVACRSKILDSQCGFRLYRLAAMRLELLTTRGFDMETEILLQTRRRGGRIEQVEVPLIYTAGGFSHFKQLNDTLKVARVISRYLFGGGKGGRSQDE